ncbi:MAG: ABC transporter ATP-binding protein [Candidatus Falkowbacteria bacterium]|nr:MAG: ABC transporter ATP-binding protein [Candidatus Falkowbacteria bacterium]
MQKIKTKTTEKKINSQKMAALSRRRSFWSDFWFLLKPFRKFFIRIVIISLIIGALGLLKPYLLKVVVDSLNNFDKERIIFLLKLIALYLTTEEVHSFIHYFSDRQILRMLVEVEYALGMRAQEKLVSLSLGYHEKQNTGAKIIKIEKGVDKISEFLNNFFWEFFPTLIQLTFTLAALFWSDWRIGSSFLFFAGIFIGIVYWSNRRMYPVRKQIYRDYETASGKMAQSIININAVQSFVQEDRELSEFGKIKNDLRKNEDKQWGWMMKIGLVRNSISDIGRATVLLLGVYLVAAGSMSVGTLIFIFTLSETAYSSLYRLTRFYDKMEEGREGVNRLLQLFNAPDEIKNKVRGFIPKKIIGEIAFKNVSFAYGDNLRTAVSKLNFKISSGSVVALVGPSGGGKTTVARLIYRHYDPQSGQVLLDGRDLRSYDLKAFRKFLAIVPQEVEIFDLTVAENIAYAKPEATQQEIQAAARIANAEEFILKLEKGYDSLVGERGIKLSGGQRQRLGIARAILANPRVLIFDEATSSLDSESERLISDAMKKISRGRTMIIIAHRLSTIKNADKIIVLENGQVAEEGNHLELARVSGGLYSKLLKLQEVGELEE